MRLSILQVRFGFGSNFFQLIKLIYSSPVASVHTNNISSDYFPFHRETGDPVGPLLFVLTIELLTIVLRNNFNVQGITRGGKIHTVTLYANDLLLYTTNPHATEP